MLCVLSTLPYSPYSSCHGWLSSSAWTLSLQLFPTPFASCAIRSNTFSSASLRNDGNYGLSSCAWCCSSFLFFFFFLFYGNFQSSTFVVAVLWCSYFLVCRWFALSSFFFVGCWFAERYTHARTWPGTTNCTNGILASRCRVQRAKNTHTHTLIRSTT